jgi:uncharacterized coiled-coil protein SlyX
MKGVPEINPVTWLEQKVQEQDNEIRKLESDLLAAEMREQFYAKTLAHYVKRIKELENDAKRKEND